MGQTGDLRIKIDVATLIEPLAIFQDELAALTKVR